MDAHLAALQKTVEYIGGEDILEVAYRVPFGFHEISNRKNISVEDFLRDSYQEKQKVIVLHILLGCGIQLEKFINCINKAVSLGERVLVLEHNKWSSDWDWSNDFEVKDHCLNNCLAYDEFTILRELYGWESFRGSSIEGTRSPDRNFIVEIFGGMPTANFGDKQDLLKRLGIPIFADGVAKPNFSHLYDVYIGTADSQTQFLENIKTPLCFATNNVLYANGGGFFSLNYIHHFRNVNFNEIVVFDINPHTIEFGKTVFEMIELYPTLQEFLKNYLLCDVTTKYKLSPIPWEDRLRLYIKNYPLYNDVSSQIFQLILNGDPNPDGLIVYGLRNCADNRTDTSGILLMTSESDRFVHENTLNVGRKGWTENQQSYEETRTVLATKTITFKVMNIKDIHPNPEDILIASNIFKGGFADRTEFNCIVLES